MEQPKEPSSWLSGLRGLWQRARGSTAGFQALQDTDEAGGMQHTLPTAVPLPASSKQARVHAGDETGPRQRWCPEEEGTWLNQVCGGVLQAHRPDYV